MPCEKAHWTVLPAIRREFARVFVLEMGLKQNEVAEILGTSEAAVSQYIKDKRGDEKVLDSKTKAYVKRLAHSKTRNAEKLVCPTCKFALKQL